MQNIDEPHGRCRISRDPAAIDERLSELQGAWWDAFYADKTRPIPFFSHAPDESLAQWVDSRAIPVGLALDIGCGNGRNAIFLARAGFRVEAVDFSRGAIDWAAQSAKEARVEVRLHHASVFDLDIEPGGFDLVCDSGCFHHMPPDERARYVDRVATALRPGGWFAMACFRPEGGSGLSDDEARERKTLGGGLGYTEQRLREIWSGPFEITALRPMEQQPVSSPRFGQGFLWAMLARRRVSAV